MIDSFRILGAHPAGELILEGIFPSIFCIRVIDEIHGEIELRKLLRLAYQTDEWAWGYDHNHANHPIGYPCG